MLTLIGPVSAPTCYGMKMRNIALGLYRIGERYRIINTSRRTANDISDAETREAVQKGLDEKEVGNLKILFLIPFEILHVDNKTILYFSWETDILPELEPGKYKVNYTSYKEPAAKARGVIATSAWCEKVYKDNGLTNVLGFVYPPTNQNVYKPVKKKKNDKFTVLISGKFEPRKRIIEMLQAVTIALDGKPARILLKTWGKDSIPTRIRGAVKEKSELRKLKHPEILLYEDFVSDEEIAALHQQADLTLMVTHSEGFGYPAAQSVLCNKPVLCTNGSALPEVVNYEEDLLVQASKGPITHGGFVMFYAPMRWYYPDMEDTIKKILLWYNKWEQSENGISIDNVRDYGLKTYTPEVSAMKLLNLVG